MKITFAGPLISTFVKNDLNILRQKYEVDAIDVNLGRGRAAAFNLIRLHIRIIKSLLASDALFFWFADYYTLVPSIIARLLRKRVYVVAGGFDITYLPHLGIGARTRPMRWFAVKNTFRVANQIFTVSQDTQNDLDSAVPSHAPSVMIYNAVDTKTFCYDRHSGFRRILTVSQADSIPEYRRKGIDLFIQQAKAFPDLEFRVVGVRGAVAEQARLEAKGIPNVIVVPGRVPLESLLKEFWQAGVYCQLSIEERFGVSVAEAMSCGCIPVVAEVNALREVVGDTGFVVNRNDPASIRSAIERSINLPETEHLRASAAAARFDIEERAKHLLANMHD